MSETALLRRIQLAATRLGGRLFRNTVAKVVMGKPQRISRDGAVFLHRGDIVVRQGRIIMVGLGVGSADLVGWRPLRITPAHVGITVAQFTSIEGKTSTTPTTPEQSNWREQVERAGGIAAVVRKPEEAEYAMRGTP